MAAIYIHGFNADRILNQQKHLENLTNGTTITEEEKSALLEKMLNYIRFNPRRKTSRY